MDHFHSYRNFKDTDFNVTLDGEIFIEGYYYFKKCVWCDKVRGRRKKFTLYGDEFYRRWRQQ